MSKVGAAGEVQKIEETRSEDVNLHKIQNEDIFNVLSEERIFLTDEQSRQVCRKIDRVILPVLAWVYFLQILDKSVLGYGAIFGMRTDANLNAHQYSLISSCGYWAQLAWQPFSAWLIVRVPHRILMPVIVFCWGIATCGLAASTNFQGLLASRFLLGLFEASCLPLFTIITTSWYRRSEQPLRVSIWYGTNGLASMLGSLLAYGCSFLSPSASLYRYQVLFLIVGLLTVLTAPWIYWKLDNNPAEARFLTPEERLWAVERLRDNNAGAASSSINWNQVLEASWSPVTWMFVALTFCVNTCASVSNTFGPLIISGFGFTSRQTILLNIPFGALQLIIILFASYLAVKFRIKSVVLACLMVPCVVGSALLYALPRENNDGPLLFGYYLIAFLFAGNPLVVSWLASNVGGQSKKSALVAFYQVGSSVGNIVGPLLFSTDQAPGYKKGLSAVLGLFVAVVAIVVLMAFMFLFLNKRKEAERVRNGKPAKIHDRSMDAKYGAHNADDDDEAAGKGVALGGNSFKDISDFKNDEFVYLI
ncbi:major facilitator superfamily domain-containing protein [Mrakia frigida]|uniref:major facilitator superfamily domain-containing protein n=1 Tax=Mrakia frigida TaxID=29902 RepID=UPI003FCC0F3D